MDRGQAKGSAILECNLCNYTTTSAYDILRHESGLLHHVKLEQKNRKCKHKCLLCGVTTESLKDFGRHANEAAHQARIALPPLLPPQQSADSQQSMRASSQPIWSSANQQQQVQPGSVPPATVAAVQRPEILAGLGARSGKLKADCVDRSPVLRQPNADSINRSSVPRQPKTDCVNRSAAPWQPKADSINRSPVSWQTPERQPTASWKSSASRLVTSDSALTVTASALPEMFDEGQLVPSLVNGGSKPPETCTTAADSVCHAKLSEQPLPRANANVMIVDAVSGNPADCDWFANARVAVQPSSDSAAGPSEARRICDDARRVVRAAKERTSVHAAVRSMSSCDVQANEPFVRLVPLVFDYCHKSVALPAALSLASGRLVSRRSPAVGGRSSAADATATVEATAATAAPAAGAAASAVATSNSATGMNGVGSRPKAKLNKPPKKAAAAKLKFGSEDSRFLFGRPPAASASRHRNSSCTSEAAQKLETSGSAVTASLDTTTASLAAARTKVAAAGDATRPPLWSDVSLNDVATQRQLSELPVIASEASFAKPFGSKPPDDEDVLGLVSSALSTKDRLRLKKIYTLARRNASVAKSVQQGPELGRAQKLRTFHLDGDDAGSCCDTAFRLLDGIKLETLSADEQLQLTSIVSSVLLTEENTGAGFASVTAVGESVATAKADCIGAAAEAFCNRSPLVAIKSEPPDTFSADQAEAGGSSAGAVGDMSFPALSASAAFGSTTSDLTSSDRADSLEAARGCTAASTTLGSEAKHNDNEPPAEVSLATPTVLPELASHSIYQRSASGSTLRRIASPAKKAASRQQWPGSRPPRLAHSIGNQRLQAKELHVGTTASDWLSSTKRKRRAQHITESLVARSGRNSPARGFPYSAAKRRNVMAAAADSSCSSSSEGAECSRTTESSTYAIGDTAVASIVAVAAPDALHVGIGVSHDPDHPRSAPSGADSSCDPSPTTIRAVPRSNKESGVRASSIDRVCTMGTNSSDVSAAHGEAVRSPVALSDGHSDGPSRPRVALPSSERCDSIAAAYEPAVSSQATCFSTAVHGPTGSIGAACRTTGSTATSGSTARLPFGPEALGKHLAGRASNACISTPVVAATASGSATTGRLTNAIAAVAQRPLRPAAAGLPDCITSYRASATSPCTAGTQAAAVASNAPEARVSLPIGSRRHPMSLLRTSSAELVSGVPKQQLPQEQQRPLLEEQLPIGQQPAAGGGPVAGSAGCSNALPPQPPESASLTARLTELVDISIRQGQVNQSLAQAHGEMVRLRDEIARLQTTFDSRQQEAELLKQEKARLARASRDILTDLAIIEEASRLAAALLPVPRASVGQKRKDACAKQPRTTKKVPSTGKPQQNPSRDCHGGKATAGGSNREIESICGRIKQEVLENEKDNEVAMNTERVGMVEHSSRTDGSGKKHKIVRHATPTEAAPVTVGNCPTNSDSRIGQADSEQDLGGEAGPSMGRQPLCPTTTYSGHTGAILDVTAIGGHLYTGSLDCTARKYELETGKCLAVYTGHTGAVRAVRVVGCERQGYQLYTGTSRGILTVFDAKTGEAVGQHDLRSAVQCMCDAWDYIYVGLASGKVASFLTTMSSTVNSFACSEQAVTCLSTATEGGRRLLCVGSQDQSVTLRDARSGLLIRELILPGDLRPAVLMVSEEESVIYVAAKKSHILAYSIETAQQIMSFSQPCRGGWIKSAVLLSGKRLLTASTDSYVRLIDLETKAVVNVYRGDPSCIMLCMCCFSGTFFTGDSAGHVIGQRLSAQRFPCEHANCVLTFGWYNHLQQHVAKEHSSAADSSCRDAAVQAAGGNPTSVDGERHPSESETTGEQVTTGRGDTALPAAGSSVRAARSAADGDKRGRQLTLK